MTDTMIVDLIVQRLVTSLTEKLQTAIDESDETRVNLVKAYRFQDDPVSIGNYVSISGGNPEDPNFQDGRINTKGMENLGLRVPAGEIGGGHLWWRRGRAQIGCFFILDGFTQDIAGSYAYTVLGRTTKAIEQTSIADLIDTFGEKGLGYVNVHASTFFESGGPPDQYIWRGNVAWQALTERPL